LAVGVGHYSSDKLQDMPCARDDAVAMYSALEDVLGDAFDAAHSLVTEDVTAAGFREFLATVLRGSEQSRDTLIVYFSGHARIQETVLELQLTDYADGGTTGLVSSIELGEFFRRAGRPDVLLILDCCFAGAAGDVAGAGDPFFPSKAAVLASSSPYQSSSPDPEGSLFTAACVKALRYLQQTRLRISARTIFETSQFYLQSSSAAQDPQFFPPQGSADLLLVEAVPIEALCYDFAQTFVDSLQRSASSDRGALWSAVGECREGELLDAAAMFFKKGNPEPLWTVRREIGNAMASVRTMGVEREAICRHAIESVSWMDVAVGVIGLRYSVGEENIKVLNALLASVHPMDVKWLAFLYISDATMMPRPEDIARWITGLGDDSWALTEIWLRAVLPTCTEEGAMVEAAHQLMVAAESDGTRSNLGNLFVLTWPDGSKGLEEALEYADPLLTDDSAIKSITCLPQRGKVGFVGIEKWLLSRLQGVWRGQLVSSIGGILRSLTDDRARKVIGLCGRLPLVEARMAAYQSMSTDRRLSATLQSNLSWGFSDSHPWVRRSAVRWLSGAKLGSGVAEEYLVRAVKTMEDSRRLPGRLDLLFEALRVAHFLRIPEDHMLIACSECLGELTAEERDALQWALDVELVPITIQ